MPDIGELRKAVHELRPITLSAKHNFLIMGAFVILLCEIGGVLMFPSNPLFASFGILLLAIPLVTTVVSFRAGATFVAVDYKGVTRCLFFQRKSVDWKEIKSIRVGWVGSELITISWNKQVIIDYVRETKPDVCAILPVMFGINAEQLRNLLTTYYEHARAAQEAPPLQAELPAIGDRPINPAQAD